MSIVQQKSIRYLVVNCCTGDSRSVSGSSYSYTANSNIRNGLVLCKFNRHHQLYDSETRKDGICVSIIMLNRQLLLRRLHVTHSH